MIIYLFLALLIFVFLLNMFSGGGSARTQRQIFHGNYYAEDAVTSEDDKPNSRESIEKCIENGLGIKTELFITADRQVVVSAYDDLSRQYDVDKKISESDLDDIQDTVMTLPQLIELVDGRVPMILELKTGINNELLCRYTADAIKASGHANIGVASFHSGIISWFKTREKKIFRGLIAAPASDFRSLSKFDRFMVGNMLSVSESRPQFALYRNKPQDALAKLIFKLGTIEGVWTLTDKEEAKALESSKTMIVCRGFMPEMPHYEDLPERQKSTYELQAEKKEAEKAARRQAREEYRRQKEAEKAEKKDK